MLNGNKLRPPSTQSQKIWITTAITGDSFFSSGSNQNLTWAIDPESLCLLEILHFFVSQRQNSNGKKNEYDYTALYQRNEIKIERRAWDWISGLFILWATGGDIKRFKQASKRNNEKWNKTGRGCYIIKFVRRLKNKREREILSPSHSLSGEVTYVIAACPSVRWVSFISVSQRVSDRRARKSFFSSSPSHVRLYDIHLSALHDGAPPVQLEEEKGGNLLHCRCVFAPIASHRHTPEYTSSVSRLPYLISFSLFFSPDILSLSISPLSLFLVLLIL